MLLNNPTPDCLAPCKELAFFFPCLNTDRDPGARCLGALLGRGALLGILCALCSVHRPTGLVEALASADADAAPAGAAELFASQGLCCAEGLALVLLLDDCTSASWGF